MKKKIFTNCIILDGTENMLPLEGKAVVVEDELIKDIISADDAGKYTDAEIIDLHGKYIMPGLINLHAHLALSGSAPKEKAKEKKTNYKLLYDVIANVKPVNAVFRSLVAKYAKVNLFSGTTTVRAVGGIMDFDSKIRDDINAGKKVGPRILCANTAVSVPGGHFAGSLGTEAKTPEEAAEDVRKIAKTNPDLIKIMITGGVMDCEVVGEPGMVKMSPEIVKAACDEAHRLGYKVAAHVESPEGVKSALENGVDTIEHGAKPNDEIIRLFKEKGAALISTTSPAIPYAVFDRSVSHCLEVAQINGKALLDGMCQCTKACLENNIPVGLGNDSSCPFTTHYNYWRELCFFHKYCGASNTLALHTATLRNAQIIGIDNITGSIANGKSADMIVVKNNPLDNLEALKDIDMVIMKGTVYDKPKVKKMADVDAALDAVM